MTHKHEDCLALLEEIRWGGVPRCPYCESTNSTAIKNKRRYRCNACFTSYSVTVGTVFHRTYVDLQKWFLAIRLVLKLQRGISVRQLAREIKVNRNTSAYMLVRIREAKTEDQKLLQSILDIDKP